MSNDHPETLPTSPDPAEPTVPSTAAREAGGVVGPYRLLERIGSGGMGEVWRAEQTEPVRRTVALKLIKPGMDSREILARFAAERQALALMDHPGIARIFDAGTTPEGRPYFAMEYVHGLPIDQYCNRRKLGTQARLALFQQVCEGVQHAHQKAVIHRDLKPGNILVADLDGGPSPRIIDFGLAKAMTYQLTADTMFTAMGQLIGTPEYMSPEQSELTGEDVDTRTDVYSLGVILYQLLAGALPFDSEELRKAGFDGVRRIIREQEPPRPSTRLISLGEGASDVAAQRGTGPRRLTRELEGDLDWIVMRCLEKDRNRRYGSPQELAQDIQRHLEDQPIIARPPSRSYRLRKLIRRNRAAATAVAVVFAALLLGVAGTTYGLVRARAAEKVARSERDEARRQSEIAQAVNDFLNHDLLAAVAPSAAAGRGKDVSMREVLDAAAASLEDSEATRARFADKPLVEAAIRTTLGQTYQMLGEYDQAQTHLQRALDLRRAHPGDDGMGLAGALAEMGELAEQQGRYAEAEALLGEALERQAAAGVGSDAATVAWLSARARVVGRLGRSAEAEPLLLEAVAVGREHLGVEHPRTLAALGSLANFYQELGRFDAAEPLQLEVLEVRRRIAGDEDLEVIRTMNNLANVYASQGRLSDAMPLYHRALELKRRLLGDDHPSTLNTMNNLATVQEIRGDYALAESLHREVYQARAATLGDDHPRTLLSGKSLAFMLTRLGRLDEAEALNRRIVAAATRTLGADHPQTIDAQDGLAVILLTRGRAAEAERLLRRLESTLREKHPDDDFTRAYVGAHWGLALAALDRVDEAVAAWDSVADILPPGEAETLLVQREAVKACERWEAAQPGHGYGAKAAAWRERMEAAPGV